MKKKILYIIPSLQAVGPTNMCLNLIRSLDLNIFDINILSLRNGVLFNDFSKFGKVSVVSWRNILKILRETNSCKFDIVHSHTTIADCYSWATIFNSVKVTTIHNYPDIDSIYRRGKLIGKLVYLLQRMAIKKFNKVACSESVEKYCRLNLGMTTLICIPNGVDKLNITKEKQNDNTVYFFYLGGINNRKNVGELVSFFNYWSVGKLAKLAIIGDGEYYDSLMKNNSNHQIVFYGRHANPELITRNMDCFISSSKAEGLPLALLESMSIGMAYICSNIAPHVEIYNKDNGASGYIYTMNDRDSFVSALDQYYYSTTKVELSNNAVKCFEKHYSASIMASEYSGFYLKI